MKAPTPPNEHIGRWCVVDVDPIEVDGQMVHHIYCSFADRSQAAMAVSAMNSLRQSDPKRPIRTKVMAINYSFPEA